MIITQDELKYWLEYRDGFFYWKQKPSKKICVGDIAANKANSNGYVMIIVASKRYYMHRLVFLYHHGRLPKFIDHINMDKADNRIENLREVTTSQNNVNTPIFSNNTSGYKGVSWCKTKQRWRALISIDNKGVALGYFKVKEDAALAYNKKAFELHGEFALLNEIKSPSEDEP